MYWGVRRGRGCLVRGGRVKLRPRWLAPPDIWCYHKHMVSAPHVSTDTAATAARSAQPMADDSAARPIAETLVTGLPPGTLHQDEIVLVLAKPSILYILITSIRFLTVVVLLAALLVYRQGMIPTLSVRTVALTAAVLVVGRLIWALLVWTSHIYILTDRRIITIKGVVNIAIFQATLRKIQRTTVYQPLYQGIFGLGTLGFATAAAVSSFDSTWVMIPRPHQTHEQIVAAIRRQS